MCNDALSFLFLLLLGYPGEEKDAIIPDIDRHPGKQTRISDALFNIFVILTNTRNKPWGCSFSLSHQMFSIARHILTKCYVGQQLRQIQHNISIALTFLGLDHSVSDLFTERGKQIQIILIWILKRERVSRNNDRSQFITCKLFGVKLLGNYN